MDMTAEAKSMRLLTIYTPIRRANRKKERACTGIWHHATKCPAGHGITAGISS